MDYRNAVIVGGHKQVDNGAEVPCSECGQLIWLSPEGLLVRQRGAKAKCVKCVSPESVEGSDIAITQQFMNELAEVVGPHEVTVTAFVNGHLVFTEHAQMTGQPSDQAVADEHIGKILPYLVNDEDVFLIEFTFSDGHRMRIGTDKDGMVVPMKASDWLRGFREGV